MTSRVPDVIAVLVLIVARAACGTVARGDGEGYGAGESVRVRLEALPSPSLSYGDEMWLSAEVVGWSRSPSVHSQSSEDGQALALGLGLGATAAGGIRFEFYKDGSVFCTSEDVNRKLGKFAPDYGVQFFQTDDEDGPTVGKGFCRQSTIHKAFTRLAIYEPAPYVDKGSTESSSSHLRSRNDSNIATSAISFSCTMQSDSGSYYVVVTSTVPLNASTSGADTSSDGDGYYVIGRSNTILVGIHGTSAHKLVPLTNYYSDGVVYSTTTNMYSVVQEPPMFILEDTGGAQHSVNTSFLEGYALRADDMASANLYLLDDRELYDGNYSGLLNWILFGSDATGYVFGFTMVDTCTELDPVQVIDSTSYFMPIAITLLLGSAILLLGVISWIMHVCIMRVHLRGQRDAYPGIRDNFTFFFRWFSIFIKLPISKVAQRSGVDAALYLQASFFNFILCATLTVIGMGVLVPIYSSSDANPLPLLKFTFFNCDFDSAQIWIVFIASWIITMLAVITLVFARLYTSKWRQTYLRNTPNPSDYTVWIKGVPNTVSQEALSKFISEKYSAEVVVRVLPRLDRLIPISEKKKALHKKLDELKGHSPDDLIERVPYAPWRKRNSIQVIQSKIAAVQAEFHQALNKSCSTGVALATFTSPKEAAAFLQDFNNGNISEHIVRSNKWSTVWWAPAPSDLLWENLHVGRVQRGLRILFGWLAKLFLSFVFYSFCYWACSYQFYLAHFFPSLGDSTLQILINGFNMVLVGIIVLANTALPVLMKKITTLEAFHTRVGFNISATFSSYLLVIVPLTLLPVFVLYPYKTMLGYLATDDEVTNFQEFLGCLFFIQLIIQSALQQPALCLMNISFLRTVISHLFKRMFCFSCYGCGSDDGACFFGAELALKLKRLSKDKPAFDFLFHYILQLLILSLALQASTFFPLILPCCCLYFGLQWFVDKYNILYVCKPVPNSPSLLKIASCCMLLSITNSWMGAMYISYLTERNYKLATGLSVALVFLAIVFAVVLRVGLRCWGACCACCFGEKFWQSIPVYGLAGTPRHTHARRSRGMLDSDLFASFRGFEGIEAAVAANQPRPAGPLNDDYVRFRTPNRNNDNYGEDDHSDGSSSSSSTATATSTSTASSASTTASAAPGDVWVGEDNSPEEMTAEPLLPSTQQQQQQATANNNAAAAAPASRGIILGGVDNDDMVEDDLATHAVFEATAQKVAAQYRMPVDLSGWDTGDEDQPAYHPATALRHTLNMSYNIGGSNTSAASTGNITGRSNSTSPPPPVNQDDEDNSGPPSHNRTPSSAQQTPTLTTATATTATTTPTVTEEFWQPRD